MIYADSMQSICNIFLVLSGAQFYLSVTTYQMHLVFSVCAIGNSNDGISLLYNHTKFICIHDCLECRKLDEMDLLHIPFMSRLIFLTNGYIFVVSRLPQLAVLAKILCLLMVSIFTYNLIIYKNYGFSVLRYKYMYLFVIHREVRDSHYRKCAAYKMHVTIN